MWVALEWIERHCTVPDGIRRGAPFRLYEFQGRYLAAFYLVAPDATVGQLAGAFAHRRGLLVGPQGIGKNPLVAGQVCLEGVGPAVFDGFAGVDDGWVCAEHGCGCGWEYAYEPGEPMGRPWSTPLIQITAFSQDSTDNTYDALRPMIELGPLAHVIARSGERFIRLPHGGRIDTVTSSDRSRLGQRVTFVPQDEVGLWTAESGMVRLADTQFRNLAKMGGRASLTTNAWDPAQQSVAQREWESKATDIYRQLDAAPAFLAYGNRRDRRKIHRAVYPSDTLRSNGGHLDLADIEAEADDLWVKDPAQAERFFGNRIVQASGAAFDPHLWATLAVSRPHPVPDGALIVLGFDGSLRHDTTALIATEVASGYQWPLGIWAPEGGEVRTAEVSAAVEDAFARYDVWRLYADPPYWETSVAQWAGRYGAERVIEWWTSRPKATAAAIRAWSAAQLTGEVAHCPVTDALCATFSEHVGNAVRRQTGYRDDGGYLWTIEKPHVLRKIDAAVAAVLSWEARNDAVTSGVLYRPAPVVPAGPAFVSY